MFKKPIAFLLFTVLILALAGCTFTGQVAPTVIPPANTPIPLTPTPVPPTATMPPAITETPVPPTAAVESSPTLAPLTETPTISVPSGPAIAHFAAGQDIAITSIHMLDATTGWAIGGLVGVGDHVFKTNDGGNTWADVTPPEPIPAADARLSAIGFFQDASAAWVTYSRMDMTPPTGEVVWRTADGGQSWQPSYALDTSGLMEVYVPSDLLFSGQSGWLLTHVGAGMNHDYVALFNSTDGGVTWTRLLDPYNDGGIQSCRKTGIRFVDGQHGWLTGTCSGVAPGVFLFETADGGASWQAVTLPPPPASPTLFEDFSVGCGSSDPAIFDTQSVKLVVACDNYNQSPVATQSFLYSTGDGGLTWTVSSFPGGTLLMLDATTGWAFSRDIYQTTDGGANWTKLTTVSWDAQFSFVSPQVGWAVARSGDLIALVTSANNGKTWAEIHPKVGP